MNVIRDRAARLIREDAAKSVISAASDIVRMGESNFEDTLPELRKMIAAYDEVIAEAAVISGLLDQPGAGSTGAPDDQPTPPARLPDGIGSWLAEDDGL